MIFRDLSHTITKFFHRGLYGGAVAACIALAVAGCSRGPSAVLPPDMDADSSAQAAMVEYDKNSDGLVDEAELASAPGLNAAMATLDVNKDGKVSAEEIANRVRAWQATRIGIMPIMCHVSLDGKPLAEATITFDPEDFLGSEIKEAVGISGSLGEFHPSVSTDPNDRHADVGVQLGLYKVRVSKQVGGKETVPARYNTQTVLGQEISNEDPNVQRHKVVFNLTTK